MSPVMLSLCAEVTVGKVSMSGNVKNIVVKEFRRVCNFFFFFFLTP